MNVAIVKTFGRDKYLYGPDGQLVAVDVPAWTDAWCVEHEAPRSRVEPRVCTDLYRRLNAGSLSDEQGDCQIVPNVTWEGH